MTIRINRDVPAQIGHKWTGEREREWMARRRDKWLTRDTQIFAIGSCFAVNFTRWLVQQGLPLAVPPWGMHYNPATILNELKSASGRRSKQLVWTVTDQFGKTKYIDAMRHTILSDNKDDFDKQQIEIERISKEMYRKADAFVITLGLSEIWESSLERSDLVINRSPYVAGDHTKNYRNRFLSVDEVVQYIQQIVEIIRIDKGDSTPIVFSISPVPLKMTNSGYDPQIANIRSKAILIAAIHSFIDEDTAKRPASYFPAYEIFLGAPRFEKLWQADLRHPTAEAIDYVCRRFIENYRYGEFSLDSIVKFTVPEVACLPNSESQSSTGPLLLS
ncbi:MAG TPA: GSCFA domain-containing protein [Rhizomicrobium sp.]|nr:GSCFA domain-containing protein [Rhizomicrobium sp.]